jgi:hypothetical protein
LPAAASRADQPLAPIEGGHLRAIAFGWVRLD